MNLSSIAVGGRTVSEARVGFFGFSSCDYLKTLYGLATFIVGDMFWH